MSMEVRTRWGHGWKKVLVHQDGFQYDGRSFATRKDLFTAIFGRDNRMPLDRYFRRGKWAPKVPPQTIFDVLGGASRIDLGGLGTCRSRYRRARQPKRHREVEAPIVTVLTAARHETGIDLARRAHEVRKLLFAGYGAWMARAGYDPEDVLQEVYKGILARNMGKSRFDSRKSSFGHYVHMVCGCVLANYHKKMTRHRKAEQVGMAMLRDDGTVYVDAAEAADGIPSEEMPLAGRVWSPEDAASYQSLLHAMSTTDAGDGMVYLAEGYTRTEIAGKVGLSPGRLNRAISQSRKALKKRIAPSTVSTG
ncbi:MAG: sigma-70 family RNA polymerase sigma factor [Gammaproteobacteria bacterium]|nr:MAG: sigma-70 family RNA polymerase sigma factor [Gammaproteobacteria bacterium]